MGHSNPTYIGTESIQPNDPFYMEICEFQKCGSTFDKVNHMSQDHPQGLSGNDYERLNFNQSEV